MSTYNCQFTYRVMMTKEEAKKSGFKGPNDYAFIDNNDAVTLETNTVPTKDDVATNALFALVKKGVKGAQITHVFHPEKIY